MSTREVFFILTKRLFFLKVKIFEYHFLTRVFICMIKMEKIGGRIKIGGRVASFVHNEGPAFISLSVIVFDSEVGIRHVSLHYTTWPFSIHIFDLST